MRMPEARAQPAGFREQAVGRAGGPWTCRSAPRSRGNVCWRGCAGRTRPGPSRPLKTWPLPLASLELEAWLEEDWVVSDARLALHWAEQAEARVRAFHSRSGCGKVERKLLDNSAR